MIIVTKQIHYNNIYHKTIEIKSIHNFVYCAFCPFSPQINDLKYVGKLREEIITLITNIMSIALTPINST